MFYSAFKISINREYDLNIWNVDMLFNSLEKSGELKVGDFVGEGKTGNVYQCGTRYVTKNYTSTKQEFVLTEIISFCAFYPERSVYVKCKENQRQVYFPKVGGFTLDDFLNNNQFSVFDLINVDYEFLIKKLDEFHAHHIYHNDIHTKNIVIEANNSENEQLFSGGLYKPNLVDFERVLTSTTRFPEDSDIQTHFLAWVGDIIKGKRFSPSNARAGVRDSLRHQWVKFYKKISEFSYENPVPLSSAFLESKKSFHKASDYYALANVARAVFRKLSPQVVLADSLQLTHLQDFSEKIKALISQSQFTDAAACNQLFLKIQNIGRQAFNEMIVFVKVVRDQYNNSRVNGETQKYLNSSENQFSTENNRQKHDLGIQSNYEKIRFDDNISKPDIDDYQSLRDIHSFRKPLEKWCPDLPGGAVTVWDKKYFFAFASELDRMISLASPKKARWLEQFIINKPVFDQSAYAIALFFLNTNERTCSLFQEKITNSCAKYIYALFRFFHIGSIVQGKSKELDYKRKCLIQFFKLENTTITQSVLTKAILLVIEQVKQGETQYHTFNDQKFKSKINIWRVEPFLMDLSTRYRQFFQKGEVEKLLQNSIAQTGDNILQIVGDTAQASRDSIIKTKKNN